MRHALILLTSLSACAPSIDELDARVEVRQDDMLVWLGYPDGGQNWPRCTRIPKRRWSFEGAPIARAESGGGPRLLGEDMPCDSIFGVVDRATHAGDGSGVLEVGRAELGALAWSDRVVDGDAGVVAGGTWSGEIVPGMDAYSVSWIVGDAQSPGAAVPDLLAVPAPAWLPPDGATLRIVGSRDLPLERCDGFASCVAVEWFVVEVHVDALAE